MELDRYLVGDRCLSGPDGRFTFDTLRDEKHDLYCFAPNQKPIHIELDPPKGQELTIRFGQTIRVSGFVFDENGAPIADANVRAECLGVLPVVATDAVHTDDAGRFLIESVRPGPNLMRVDKRGFGSVKPWFDLKADGEPIEITLGPEVELAGHVFDSSRRPIAGAHVTVRDVTLGTTLGEMDTQADGGWWMYWVPPHHRIDLELSKAGFDVTFLSSVETPAKDTTIVLQRLSSLAIVVRDEQHAPIPDFTIAVALGSVEPAKEIETRLHRPIHPVHSPDGHFDITGIQSGSHEITIRAEGFVPMVLSDLNTNPGQTLGPLDVTLVRGVEIGGRVIDETGNAVAGAEVIEPTAAFGGQLFLSDHQTGVKTASDGSFTLSGATPSIALVVRAPGRGTTLFSDLRAADFPRDLTIASPGSIDGQVITPWQSPETCVRVRASLDRTWVGQELHPDVTGRFRFASLSPGRYRLDVIDDWQLEEQTSDATLSRWVDVRSGETTTIDLEARGEGRIEGRVTGDPSIGRERLQVLVFRGDSVNDTPEACVNVDDNGLFHATQLAPGPCRLLLTSSWAGVAFSSEQTTSIHSDGTPTRVEFHVDKSSAKGRITDSSGQPLDAIAALVADPSGTPITSVRTDANGSFDIHGTPPGTVRIHATSTGCADAFTEPLDFSAIEPPTIDLRLDPESRLLVSVRDDLGHPLPSATVNLYAWTYPEALRRSAATTDGRGQFTFPRLPAGRVQLSASAPGHVPAGPIDASLARAEDRRVDLVLTRIGTLVVAVTDPNGRPARDVALTLHIVSPTASDPPRDGKTDETGQARFENLRPSHYRVRHGELDSAEADVAPGATTTSALTITP